MNNFKPNEFAEMIGVSVKTLQRWDNEGKLKAKRTPTDRRYYTHQQYIEYVKRFGNPEGLWPIASGGNMGHHKYP